MRVRGDPGSTGSSDGMSTPSLTDIARRLGELSRDLDAKTDEAETLDERAVKARHAYEIAYSRAFLSSTGSVDARKHHAVIETEIEKLEAEVADQSLAGAGYAP